MLNLLATSSTTEDRDPDQVHPPCVLASLGVPLRPARMEALGTLSCSIAHDLNNVLTPILLGLDTLQQEDISRRARLALAIIESNTRRAADLVDQITAFALGGRAAAHPGERRKYYSGSRSDRPHVRAKRAVGVHEDSSRPLARKGRSWTDSPRAHQPRHQCLRGDGRQR